MVAMAVEEIYKYCGRIFGCNSNHFQPHSQSSFAKFEVLMVVPMKIFFWDVASSNFVILYQCLGGTHIPNYISVTGTYISLNMGT
jgi:hypothetical protein